MEKTDYQNDNNNKDSQYCTAANDYIEAGEHFKNAINAVLESKTYRKEISLAKKAIDNSIRAIRARQAKNKSELDITNKVYGLAGEIYSRINKEKSLEYFKLFQYYTFKDWITKIKKNKDKEKFYFKDKIKDGVTAYKFSTCSPYLFADLAENKITLHRPECMNDPFDSLYNIWSKEENLSKIIEDKISLPMFNKSFDYYRFCSFCIDDDAKKKILKNILMWSHYADEHKGICIKYKLNGNCIMNDQYADAGHLTLLHRIEYKNINPMSVKEKSIQIGLAFTHKAPCWKYEKEARLICYNDKEEKEHVAFPYDNNISIEAVYFGLHCSDENKVIIKRLLSDQNIKYYEMKYNYDNVYNMEWDDMKWDKIKYNK